MLLWLSTCLPPLDTPDTSLGTHGRCRLLLLLAAVVTSKGASSGELDREPVCAEK